MDISSTLPAGQTASPSSAATGKSAISADFEMFLKMLTVQMKNQDPLDPIDSADYAVQLATFSGVEQQVQTNDLLRDMVAAFGAASMADMAGWVGLQARSTAPAAFTGQPVSILPQVDAAADAAQIAVRDELGREVARLDIGLSGAPVTWSGTTATGATAPAGLYRFDTISSLGGQQIAERPAESYSTVTEVQSDGGRTLLILAGGASIPAAEVTALRDPALG